MWFIIFGILYFLFGLGVGAYFNTYNNDKNMGYKMLIWPTVIAYSFMKIAEKYLDEDDLEHCL
jgi:hypothetical protein